MGHWFSPAQCVGYVAFVLGITSFLQTNDNRLKLFNGIQCVVYAVHFAMLGVTSAAASLSLSTMRNIISLRTRSAWLALIFVLANIALGARFAHSWVGWMPVAASCIATIAFFLTSGVAMRLLLICSSICWLVNNIRAHSIGGIALESVLLMANISTMIRLLLQPQSGDKSDFDATGANATAD